jgi:threonine synthase
MYSIVDFRTKQPVTPTNFVFAGPDGQWEIMMDLKEVKSRVNSDYFRKAPPYVSKYLPFMPVKDFSNFVSLEEGASPLIKSKNIGKRFGLDLYFKLESRNPTGSFKDRGSAVELSVAQELGVKAIAVASTGNMAASCSCYAAKAQIPCFIFVPEDTPASKLCQSISYGGRIVQVKGTYSDAANLAREVAEKLGFYLAGDYAYRVEGQKTAAFEVIEQLFYQVPSMVFVPMGCGTNMAGYDKGFKEYRELGFIDSLPQLIGVQAEGASSIVQSFERGAKTVERLKTINTISSAIAVPFPLDGEKALDAIYSTNGKAIAVTDQETLEASYMLSREEGLFVESSCATSLAALIKLSKVESLEGKKIVCVLKGDGQKDTTPMLKLAVKPATIYPDVKEFLTRYENNFFESRNISFVPKETVLFSVQPDLVELKRSVLELFGVEYGDSYLSDIHETVASFLKKGKPITFSDFQDIVQDRLESVQSEAKEDFQVKDFEIITWKDKKPLAKVVAVLKGREIKAESDGVGPVDAVINALKIASKDAVDFSLANYFVEIRSAGTDAVVYVELKLVSDGVVSIGRGTSPDIIQASIEAFVKAYNAFPS